MSYMTQVLLSVPLAYVVIDHPIQTVIMSTVCKMFTLLFIYVYARLVKISKNYPQYIKADLIENMCT